MKNSKNLYALYQTDRNLLRDGVWHQFGEARFLLAFNGDLNPLWASVHDEVMKPARSAIANDLLSAEQIEELQLKVFVKACVKGWENVEGHDGPIEFTPENAHRLFKDLPILERTLRSVAGNYQHYLVGNPETDAKN